MYNKLLIETGGGIIATSQMAKQDNAVTINIGLGGTGIDCLKMLKKEVYNRLCPDNGADSIVPEYKHIKFLAVDTDKSSLDSTKDLNTINDTSDEFFDISSSDINALLKGIAKNKAIKSCSVLYIQGINQLRLNAYFKKQEVFYHDRQQGYFQKNDDSRKRRTLSRKPYQRRQNA